MWIPAFAGMTGENIKKELRLTHYHLWSSASVNLPSHFA